MVDLVYGVYIYWGGGVQFLVIIPTHCDTLSITGIRLWYIIYYCMTHTIWLPWYTGYTYFGRGGCPNFSHHPYTLRYTLKNGYTSMVNPLFLLLYESYFLVALVYGVYVFWGGVPILVIPAKHWDSLRIRGIRLWYNSLVKVYWSLVYEVYIGYHTLGYTKQKGLQSIGLR